MEVHVRFVAGHICVLGLCLFLSFLTHKSCSLREHISQVNWNNSPVTVSVDWDPRETEFQFDPTIANVRLYDK